MKRSTKIALIFIFLLFSGCSSKQSPLKVYTLNTPVTAEIPSNNFKHKTIKVMYPQSLKEKVSQKMNYSYSSAEQGVYLNSQWSNTIGKLLEGTIIQALDASRLFKAVLPYASTAQEDYRLESNIYAFSHEVRGDQSHALVSMQFSLISTQTGKLVKIKRFTYKVATRTTDAKGYVEAANIAVERLSKDLLRWLQF